MLRLLLIIVLSVVLIMFIFRRCSLKCKCSRDNYGQDASIRVSSGWVAGPSYGEDPIVQFANQIDEMKNFNDNAKKIGCGHVCNSYGYNSGNEDCQRCLENPPKETLVIGVMPLDTPTNPQPGYPKREQHPPYLPPNVIFDENYQNKSSCKACS